MKNIIKTTIEKLTGKTTYYIIAGKIEKKTTSLEDKNFYKKIYGEVFETYKEAEEYQSLKETIEYLCK